MKALAEARARSEAGDTSDGLRILLDHARELHDLLLENLIAAEPATAQYAHGLADSMANHLDELEQLVELNAQHAATGKEQREVALARRDRARRTLRSISDHAEDSRMPAMRRRRAMERDISLAPVLLERCKLIDLGAWASERYRVPVAERPDDDLDGVEDDDAPPRAG